MDISSIPLCKRPYGLPERYIYRRNDKIVIISYEPNGNVLCHVDMEPKHVNPEVAVRNRDGFIAFNNIND